MSPFLVPPLIFSDDSDKVDDDSDEVDEALVDVEEESEEVEDESKEESEDVVGNDSFPPPFLGGIFIQFWVS